MLTNLLHLNVCVKFFNRISNILDKVIIEANEQSKISDDQYPIYRVWRYPWSSTRYNQSSKLREEYTTNGTNLLFSSRGL